MNIDSITAALAFGGGSGGGGGSKDVLIVHYTWNDEGENGTTDKTASEIIQAIESGVIPVLVDGEFYYYLDNYYFADDKPYIIFKNYYIAPYADFDERLTYISNTTVVVSDEEALYTYCETDASGFNVVNVLQYEGEEDKYYLDQALSNILYRLEAGRIPIVIFANLCFNLETISDSSATFSTIAATINGDSVSDITVAKLILGSDSQEAQLLLGNTSLGGGGGDSSVNITCDRTYYYTSYYVPYPTSEQIVQAYNGIVAGKNVIISSSDGTMHFEVNQADGIGDDITISIIYYDKFIVTYYVDGQITFNEINPYIIVHQDDMVTIGESDEPDQIPLDMSVQEIGRLIEQGKIVFGNVSYYFEDPETGAFSPRWICGAFSITNEIIDDESYLYITLGNSSYTKWSYYRR